MVISSDSSLVQAGRRGDLRAFEQLVERHRDLVFRVVARFVGSEDAEDVTQDTFLRAFHRLERFRGEAPLHSWLLRIAHNTAVTHVTPSGRVTTHPIETVEEDVDASVSRSEPAERLERREYHAEAPEPQRP